MVLPVTFRTSLCGSAWRSWATTTVRLRRAVACALRFGLVVVDPPSFAPSEKALPRALSAYRDLLALAMQVVEPGGLLCAASCSSHVDQEVFLNVLGDASRQVDRPLRILEVHGQPADHPSLPNFPEGRYLKFVVGCLLGRGER